MKKPVHHCDQCHLHHPERPPEKECSMYGHCENKDGDCSGYIGLNPNAMTVEEFVRRRLERKT